MCGRMAQEQNFTVLQEQVVILIDLGWDGFFDVNAHCVFHFVLQKFVKTLVVCFVLTFCVES